MESRITVIQLLNQLKEAKRNIRGWHGMGEPDPAKEKTMWEIYEENSPEMKRLNESIEFGERWLNEPEKTIDVVKQENANDRDGVFYATGLINGIKTTLMKLLKRIRAKPGMFHPILLAEFSQLLNDVNEFPTVKDKGSFVVDPATTDIIFKNHKTEIDGNNTVHH